MSEYIWTSEAGVWKAPALNLSLKTKTLLYEMVAVLKSHAVMNVHVSVYSLCTSQSNYISLHIHHCTQHLKVGFLCVILFGPNLNYDKM